MATSTEKKKYSIISLINNYINSAGTTSGTENSFVIDAYSIYSDKSVIIDCHFIASTATINAPVKKALTLPLNVKIFHVSVTWRDTFAGSESTDVAVDYSNGYTNTLILTWKSTLSSGYNRYNIRVFGYIE